MENIRYIRNLKTTINDPALASLEADVQRLYGQEYFVNFAKFPDRCWLVCPSNNPDLAQIDQIKAFLDDTLNTLNL